MDDESIHPAMAGITGAYGGAGDDPATGEHSLDAGPPTEPLDMVSLFRALAAAARPDANP